MGLLNTKKHTWIKFSSTKENLNKKRIKLSTAEKKSSNKQIDAPRIYLQAKSKPAGARKYR